LVLGPWSLVVGESIAPWPTTKGQGPTTIFHGLKSGLEAGNAGARGGARTPPLAVGRSRIHCGLANDQRPRTNDDFPRSEVWSGGWKCGARGGARTPPLVFGRWRIHCGLANDQRPRTNDDFPRFLTAYSRMAAAQPTSLYRPVPMTGARHPRSSADPLKPHRHAPRGANLQKKSQDLGKQS